MPMTTTTARTQTAFRLSNALLERLRREAEREHRSLNNLVELLLMEALEDRPNPETLAAIEEARSGKYAGMVDTDSVEAFIKSIEG